MTAYSKVSSGRRQGQAIWDQLRLGNCRRTWRGARSGSSATFGWRSRGSICRRRLGSRLHRRGPPASSAYPVVWTIASQTVLQAAQPAAARTSTLRSVLAFKCHPSKRRKRRIEASRRAQSQKLKRSLSTRMRQLTLESEASKHLAQSLHRRQRRGKSR